MGELDVRCARCGEGWVDLWARLDPLRHEAESTPYTSEGEQWMLIHCPVDVLQWTRDGEDRRLVVDDRAAVKILQEASDFGLTIGAGPKRLEDMGHG
jgi:hypothetical protein